MLFVVVVVVMERNNFFFVLCIYDVVPVSSFCWHSLMSQVKDLGQRLSKATDGKTLAEENHQALERREQSMEAELVTTKTCLEARQEELSEVKDKASDVKVIVACTRSATH